MSYQVLARKWRPRIFREMVGQEHVLQALINALDNNRLHHAYLFTGTRGVGKTTIARILAKCLNCEQGVSSEPCGQCGACTEIADGRFIDLIEVDAASRTKVEDTRELLDNVQYAPSRGRYKVYLIDEVHMLSNSSFNALLKTLEEPPPHVKFLLATTDPQKLPVTVLSRCLQFNLKNMNPERIVSHLQYVLGQESVPFDDASLWQLGRAADGSMRDALSLTDQAIAFGSGKIVEAEVRSMLGNLDQSLVVELIAALAQQNPAELMAVVERLSQQAPDYRAALAELLSVLHRIAIAQALPAAVDNSAGDKESILALAAKITSEDIQLFYQTALLGRRDLPLSPDPRGGFEMVLLRMLAFKPQGVPKVPQQRLQPAAIDVPASPEPVAVAPAATLAPVQVQSVEVAPAPAPIADEPPWQTDVPDSATKQTVPSVEPAANNTADSAEPSLQPVVSSPEPIPSSSESNPISPEPVHTSSEPKVSRPEPIQAATQSGYAEPVRQDNGVVGNLAANVQSSLESVPEAVNSSPVIGQQSAALAQQTAEILESAPTINSEAGLSPPMVADVPTTAANTETAIQSTGSNSILEALNSPDIQPVESFRKKSDKSERSKSFDSEVVEEKISWEHLNSEQWIALYRQLRFEGVLQATTSNCVLLHKQDSGVLLGLDRNQTMLYDDGHQQRIAQLFSEYFGRDITITIDVVTPEWETPAACIIRLKQQRLDEAKLAIQTDPAIIQLIEEFDARVVEDSITPID